MKEIPNHISSTLRSWGLIEYFIFIAFSCFGIGFLSSTTIFAKIGLQISLPNAFGKIVHLQPKIFITEWLLLTLLLVTIGACIYDKEKLKSINLSKSPILQLCLVFFCFGLFRLAIDIRENPILAIRNACFVWYLSVPLMISILAPKRTAIEAALLVCSIFTMYQFLYSWFFVAIGLQPRMLWSYFLGINLFVGIAFCARFTWLVKLLLLLVVSGLTFSYLGYPSRTALLGAAVLVFLIGVSKSYRPKNYNFRLACSALIVIVSFFIYNGVREIRSHGAHEITKSEYIDKIVKGEANQYGIQRFRSFLWKDAANLFLSNPLFGIGFVQQVVYRLYQGDGRFYENKGREYYYSPQDRPQGAASNVQYIQTAVSGPHNSYLNAITRLGVFGSLVLIIHFLALFTLYRSKSYVAFISLYSQVLYAFFNVGLESPIYGFFSLLALSVALLVEKESAHVSLNKRSNFSFVSLPNFRPFLRPLRNAILLRKVRQTKRTVISDIDSPPRDKDRLRIEAESNLDI